MRPAYDAVVVGAGPYGLSTAAHLRGRGLRVAVFGRALEMWRGHMPTGMRLRSHWWATNLSDPKVSADHILLATGYTVDIAKLTMIHPSLRAEIKTDRAIPILSHWFESSVPGLYFVGLTSMRAFGPLYRFVAGCGAAARRVASSVTRERVERSRATPKRAAFANRAADKST